MSIKLFNQGKRTIRGEAIDPRDGKLKPYAFPPKSALEFDEETARKLKKIYGHEILSVDDVKSQFDQAMQASDSPPAQPSMAAAQPKAPVDDLAGLSSQERDLVLALRSQPEVPPPPPQAAPTADPSQFVNVTEEEARAAKAAIDEVRQRNAAYGDNGAGADPTGLLAQVAAKLKNMAGQS